MLERMADMKRMGRSGVIVAAVSALTTWGAAAQASVLQFTYTYNDGSNFTVVAEGALGADNNTFTVAKVDQVYGNGAAAFADPSKIIVTANQNVLTLNGGTSFKFQLSDSNYNVLVHVENSSATQYSAAVSYVTSHGSTLPNEYSNVFVPSSYSASLVPEPATAGLFGVMLAGFGVARRFRRPCKQA